MHLTVFSDYTLRTLMYLALRPHTLCTIDDIADAYSISANHLMKVVHQAAQAGEVETVRGQGGGLRLARAPEAINVGTILRRTEPNMEIAPCFGSGTSCAIQSACVLQGVLGSALEAFLSVLDGVTLADLVHPRRQLATLLRMNAGSEEATGERPVSSEMIVRPVIENTRRPRSAS
jgi:Rrf2 family transcriptional regulator, nitric oxide-sensitive transcriptional repressor